MNENECNVVLRKIGGGGTVYIKVWKEKKDRTATVIQNQSSDATLEINEMVPILYRFKTMNMINISEHA